MVVLSGVLSNKTMYVTIRLVYLIQYVLYVEMEFYMELKNVMIRINYLVMGAVINVL